MMPPMVVLEGDPPHRLRHGSLLNLWSVLQWQPVQGVDDPIAIICVTSSDKHAYIHAHGLSSKQYPVIARGAVLVSMLYFSQCEGDTYCPRRARRFPHDVFVHA